MIIANDLQKYLNSCRLAASDYRKAINPQHNRNMMNSFFRKVILPITLASLLAACENSSTPDKSWENAAKGVYSGSLSKDGKYAVIGSIHHGGSLWTANDGERKYDWNHQQGQYSNIIASGFSPEGAFALTADHQTMVLWDTATGESITFWTAPNEVMSVDLTPNGTYALLGLGDYSAVLFDVKRGGIQRTFYHTDRVRAVALSADGKLAITGSEDETARLWDMNTGKALFSWKHEGEVVTVAISPDGTKAFSVAKYDKAVLWDTSTGEEIGRLALTASALKRGQAFTTARFSADGKRILTGNSSRLVQLWDTKTLSKIASWEVPKRDPWKPTGASIVAVSFSDKNNEYYAIASNGFTHRLKL
ncbi:MAG: WD40 repeat protein [Oceanicoccus sp.]